VLCKQVDRIPSADARLGADVDAFLGIKYALPPVGDRRFKVRSDIVASEPIIACLLDHLEPAHQLVDTVILFVLPAVRTRVPLAWSS
jgi:hypothetical protein